MRLDEAYREFSAQCRHERPPRVWDALRLYRWAAVADIAPEDPKQALMFAMESHPDEPSLVEVTLARDFWIGDELERLGLEFVVPSPAGGRHESLLLWGMPSRWPTRTADQLETDAFLTAVRQALEDRRLLDVPPAKLNVL
jgi:hypothetical protein